MIHDFITLENCLNSRGRQQNELVHSIHPPSIQSQPTHAYHGHDFANQFGVASSPIDQYYEAPTNDVDVDDGTRAATKPMTPHYEAPTSEGCSSIFTPQSKIEKCIK